MERVGGKVAPNPVLWPHPNKITKYDMINAVGNKKK